MLRNPQRGIHAPLTNRLRRIRAVEVGALQLLRPGAITIFEDQLKDESFISFLHHEASTEELEVYCRLIPVEGPEPIVVAMRLVGLAKQYPWIRGWVPISEPNQWSRFSWPDISIWVDELYSHVTMQRRTNDVHFLLFFPPLAQDMGGEKDHRVGWEHLRRSIEHFLENGDGFSWYSSWHAMDHRRLTEREMPRWLFAALEDGDVRQKTLIVEAGRFYQEPLGIEGSYGDEIIERFGSRARRMRSYSLAHAVTMWVLGSAVSDFQHQAWIDEEGHRKDIIDYIAQWGP